MFVLSVKAGRRQLLSVAVFLLVAVFAAVAVIAAPSMEQVSVSASVKKAQTTEQRVAFLKSLGYEVGETEEVQEICLPDEADKTLLQYEIVQQKANMSLEPYYGKRVRLYTYSVLNAAEAATAHVYVYRDRIVAGDVSSERGGAFCLPLMPKEPK